MEIAINRLEKYEEQNLQWRKHYEEEERRIEEEYKREIAEIERSYKEAVRKIQQEFLAKKQEVIKQYGCGDESGVISDRQISSTPSVHIYVPKENHDSITTSSRGIKFNLSFLASLFSSRNNDAEIHHINCKNKFNSYMYGTASSRAKECQYYEAPLCEERNKCECRDTVFITNKPLLLIFDPGGTCKRYLVTT